MPSSNQTALLLRYWREEPLDDNSLLLMHEEKYVRKYFKLQSLEHWIEDKVLLLIGQAGSGKSTYLSQYHSDSSSLYISLQNTREFFAEEIERELSWTKFCDLIEDNPNPFQLFLDGWDELNDIDVAKNNLRKILESVPNNKRNCFRLRIASRPGLQSSELFDELKRRADWLIPDKSSNDIKCLYLSGLFRDQVVTLFNCFAGSKSVDDFWKWCYDKNVQALNGHIQSCIFLINSYLNPSSRWTSLIELWEEMMGYKVEYDLKYTKSLSINSIDIEVGIYHF